MAIAGELAALRGRFTACRAMALTDLATGLVLCAATRERIAQEQLDALCATARGLLAGPVEAAISGIENSPPALAILAEGSGIALFLRLPYPATEALCCACDTTVDLAGLAAAAEGFLGALDLSVQAGSGRVGGTAA